MFPKINVKKWWRLIFCLTYPLALLPLVFLEDEERSKKYKCLYVILLMGGGWMVEAMPLAITALLPVALLPFLGIQSTASVVSNYMRDTGMMFIGGISLALAIEKSQLHKRIALNMMLLIGISPWRILLGVMVTTFTLSCWIVGNTAVTAMMIPIVSGLVESIEDGEERKKLRILYMLATGYAANIGGTAVMIGSIPNIIFKDLVAEEDVGQNGKYRDINFATWIIFNMPIAVINLLLVWLYLGFLYLGRKQKISNSNNVSSNELEANHHNHTSSTSPSSSSDNLQQISSNQVGNSLRSKLQEMGGMSFHEKGVCFLFLIAVILWFTRDPQIFKGWLGAIDNGVTIADSTVAIVVLIFMFIIPSSLHGGNKKGEDAQDYDTLLTWSYLQTHFPWSVILLVGGGFAISDAANVSGLSSWIGDQLNSLESLSPPVLLLIVLGVVSLFTEIMSNAASISLLTPILISLSKKLQIHPLYITFAGAISCQYAFILPTSNPPNAIVFSAGRMKVMDMVRAGIPLNVGCLLVLYLMNLTWGQFLFNFDEYEYANVTTRFS